MTTNPEVAVRYGNPQPNPATVRYGTATITQAQIEQAARSVGLDPDPALWPEWRTLTFDQAVKLAEAPESVREALGAALSRWYNTEHMRLTAEDNRLHAQAIRESNGTRFLAGTAASRQRGKLHDRASAWAHALNVSVPGLVALRGPQP